MGLNTRTSIVMKHLPRLLNFALALLPGLTATAQYSVVVNGQLTPCAPANAGGTVIVSTAGFLEPPQTVTAILDSNCHFYLTMILTNPTGNLHFASSCGNGSMATDTVAYDAGSSPADTLFITLNCGPADPCNAAFTVQQAGPWQISTTNTSTGSGTLTYQWWMPDGSSSTEAEPTWTFNAPGLYGICLTITADNGSCTDWMCDSVVVDSNGVISTNPIWYDCEGTMWGPAVPGAPCDDGNPMTNGDTWTTNCMCQGQGGGTTDCLGVPGGSALPGTPCVTFLGDPGTWSANCVCVPDSVVTGCQALFTVTQATGAGAIIPWVMNTVNQSTGTGPLTFHWVLPDGSTSTEMEPSFTFTAPGAYTICLTVASGNGCTSTSCDSVYVDNLGHVNGNTPIWYDCLGIPFGNALPGTPCNDPQGNTGLWDMNCLCNPDTSTTCEANFWAIQAYQPDSLNPGGGTPIPNVVWVWNLSSGGNGTYQFFWDFGDGTSSTEAYPTHEYSGNGPWLLCLTMSSGNCTDTYCDSVSVDEDGILNGLIVDGHPHSTTYSPRSDGFTLNVISEIPSGINELHGDVALRLWPNPVDDALNVAFQATGGTGSMSIIDGSGRTVKTIAERFSAGANRLSVPVDDLAPGLYLVRLNNGNNSISARFLKTR